MKRTLILIAAICAAVLVTPAASAKAGEVDKLAASTCADERKALGRKAFTKKYGERRTMHSCIRRSRVKVRNAQRQAERNCGYELMEVGLEVFIEDYGSDDTGTDAMANCIADWLDYLLEPPGLEEEEEEELEV